MDKLNALLGELDRAIFMANRSSLVEKAACVNMAVTVARDLLCAMMGETIKLRIELDECKIAASECRKKTSKGAKRRYPAFRGSADAGRQRTADASKRVPGPKRRKKKARA